MFLIMLNHYVLCSIIIYYAFNRFLHICIIELPLWHWIVRWLSVLSALMRYSLCRAKLIFPLISSLNGCYGLYAQKNTDERHYLKMGFKWELWELLVDYALITCQEKPIKYTTEGKALQQKCIWDMEGWHIM